MDQQTNEQRRRVRYFIQNSVAPQDYRPKQRSIGTTIMLYVIYFALVLGFICYVLIGKK